MNQGETIRVGEQYVNTHTAIECIVIDKIFFNIVYINVNEQKDVKPQYRHYKTFQKHWIKAKI